MVNVGAHIAVVEDGVEDFDLLRYAFNACGAALPLIQYSRAAPVIELFERRQAPTNLVPSLVILDLNLPDIDGRDVLLHLRSLQAGKAVPIIVLTTSNNPQDINLCYSRGATAYIVKPVGVAKLKQIAKTLSDFWLEMVELPQ